MPHKDPEVRRAYKREYMKAYRSANRERILARERAWREANKERVDARDRAWQAANKERRNAISRAWREANKDRAVSNGRAWRAAAGAAFVTHILKHQGFHKDHITPELIEVKRLNLFIKRELRKEKQP
jgi:uncharacterized damage-inducible protein DinB